LNLNYLHLLLGSNSSNSLTDSNSSSKTSSGGWVFTTFIWSSLFISLQVSLYDFNLSIILELFSFTINKSLRVNSSSGRTNFLSSIVTISLSLKDNFNLVSSIDFILDNFAM